MPAQLHDLSIEHSWSIGYLIAAGRHASAFALVRSQFECSIRGLWIHKCALDAQIERFLREDAGIPVVEQMIAGLEDLPDFKRSELSVVWSNARRAMNGYTHGGIHQLSRRMNGNYVEAVFDDEVLLAAIELSAQTAVMAFSAIADMASRDDLTTIAQTMMNSASQIAKGIT